MFVCLFPFVNTITKLKCWIIISFFTVNSSIATESISTALPLGSCTPFNDGDTFDYNENTLLSMECETLESLHNNFAFVRLNF